MMWDTNKLKCSDYRLSTPIIYGLMDGDPCCVECHMAIHRNFGYRKGNGKDYKVCCTMVSFCIKKGKVRSNG